MYCDNTEYFLRPGQDIAPSRPSARQITGPHDPVPQAFQGLAAGKVPGVSSQYLGLKTKAVLGDNLTWAPYTFPSLPPSIHLTLHSRQSHAGRSISCLPKPHRTCLQENIQGLGVPRDQSSPLRRYASASRLGNAQLPLRRPLKHPYPQSISSSASVNHQ